MSDGWTDQTDIKEIYDQLSESLACLKRRSPMGACIQAPGV